VLPMVLAALCAIDGDFRLAHGLHPGYRSRMQGCTLAIVRACRAAPWLSFAHAGLHPGYRAPLAEK
jgi:hypothetical protein